MNNQEYLKKLECELVQLMIEMQRTKPRKHSNAYQLLLSRQNRLQGAIAVLKGEVV